MDGARYIHDSVEKRTCPGPSAVRPPYPHHHPRPPLLDRVPCRAGQVPMWRRVHAAWRRAPMIQPRLRF